jgi:hypothetical protein
MSGSLLGRVTSLHRFSVQADYRRRAPVLYRLVNSNRGYGRSVID